MGLGGGVMVGFGLAADSVGRGELMVCRAEATLALITSSGLAATADVIRSRLMMKPAIINSEAIKTIGEATVGVNMPVNVRV